MALALGIGALFIGAIFIITGWSGGGTQAMNTDLVNLLKGQWNLTGKQATTSTNTSSSQGANASSGGTYGVSNPNSPILEPGTNA